MEKILFINACARPNSRTYELAKSVLSEIKGNVEEVDLYKITLTPLDFAGIDILFSENGPLICEVNSNAHFKSTYDCTGVDLADLIAEHIINKCR